MLRVLAWSRAINRPRLAIALLVFALALTIRIHGISQHFWLLADQIRDWAIALRPFSELPLVGPPTHVGGYTIGPAFYWILWTLRVLFGPWFDNLPHAGGIGQAALQSLADALLLVAIWKRTGSPWIALATIVIVATAAFDVSLAALVWNPPMGAALAKLAIAAVLADWHRGSIVRAAITAAIAWSAVHAYTGAIFVVLGVFTAMLIDPFLRGDRTVAVHNTVVIAVAVLLLQLPLVVFQLTKSRDAAMGAVTDSLSRVYVWRKPARVAEKSDWLRAGRSGDRVHARVGAGTWMAAADLQRCRLGALPERSSALVCDGLASTRGYRRLLAVP